MTKIKELQETVARLSGHPLVIDGDWGPKCQAALEAILQGGGDSWHSVLASSFADPADVAAFKRCKEKGGSDLHCFRVGDNAIGLWGDSTATGTGPSVALPPEVWRPFYYTARRKKLIVKYGDKEVICQLKDTMPSIKNIKNGARIDLNPDACSELGLQPPMMAKVQWKWYE